MRITFIQDFLGWLWCKINKKKISQILTWNFGIKMCIVPTSNYGLTLGKYIFVPNLSETTLIMHETGHYRQSLKLGIFYLFVIGIPSVIWFRCFEKYRVKNQIDYYSFYTEKWADKLGGVVR